MKFLPEQQLLKNGKLITLRLCQIEDATNLIHTIKTYIADSDHIPVSTEEFNPSIETETKLIQSFLDNENSLLLVAIYNDRIIGNIDITGSQRSALEHTALVGMGILKEWRGQGLGTIMLDHCIQWARNNTILKKLWLQVYAKQRSRYSPYTKKEGLHSTVFNKTLLKPVKALILTTS